MLKHFTIPEYQKRTGASRAAIEKMIAEGLLKSAKSEGGKVTYVLLEENEEIVALETKIDDLSNMMKALMAHLGAGGIHGNPRTNR
jgi:hypothetical protein